MRSHHHLLLSVVVGIPMAVTVSAALPPAAVVGYAAAVGVLVDVDHFVLARHRTGDWRALRRGLAAPRLLTVRQSELFEPGEVGPFRRLVSHLLLAGALVAGLAAVGPRGLAPVTAVVLYVHVLADVVWEARHRGSDGRVE